jgi:hypothetical protein
VKRKIASSVAVLVPLGILVVGAVLWEKGRIDTRRSDSLRIIFLAQCEYARGHPDKGFATSLEDLGNDSRGSLVDSVLASGTQSGYEFILWTGGPNSQGRVSRFFVVARPQKYQEGERSFFIDESGLERFTPENLAATAADPPVH